MENILLEKKNFKIILLVSMIICITAIIKFILCLEQKAPDLMNDELAYRRIAEFIFSNSPYVDLSNTNLTAANYPILYSIVLSPAFLFGDNFYIAMKGINIILSSIAIIGVWKLSRVFLDEKKSLFCCLIFAVIPFMWRFPQATLSENLFYPLIIFALFFFVKDYSKHLFRDNFILALLLAAMINTRHAAWVVLIVFAAAWIVKYFFIKKEIGLAKKMALLCMVAGTVCALYLPWLFYCFSKGFTLMEATGSKASPAMRGVAFAGARSYIKWFVFYCSYLLLMIAPFFVYLQLAIKNMIKNKFRTKENKYFVFIIVLAFAMILIATLHSAKAYYNYPVPGYIIGRYITYLFVPFLIMGAIGIKGLYENKMVFKKWEAFLYPSISIGIIMFSYLLIVKGSILNIGSGFLWDHNANDILIYQYFNIYLLVCFIPNILAGIVLWNRKNKSDEIKPRRLFILPVVALTILIFYLLSGGYTFWRRLDISRDPSQLNNVVYQTLECVERTDGIEIINDTGVSGLDILYQYLYAGFDIKEIMDIRDHSLDELKEKLEQPGYLLSNKLYTEEEEVLKHIWTGSGTDYYIYKLPIEIQDVKSVPLLLHAVKTVEEMNQFDGLFKPSLSVLNSGFSIESPNTVWITFAEIGMNVGVVVNNAHYVVPVVDDTNNLITFEYDQDWEVNGGFRLDIYDQNSLQKTTINLKK